MQRLRLYIAVDVERLRQEIRVPYCRLLHFAPLQFSVRPRRFLDRFESVLKRDPEHRSNHISFLAPRRRNFCDRFVAPRQPIAQDAGDHRQRDQQHQNQRADSEQFDDRAMPPAKRRLRFWQRWWHLLISHPGRLTSVGFLSTDYADFGRFLESSFLYRLSKSADDQIDQRFKRGSRTKLPTSLILILRKSGCFGLRRKVFSSDTSTLGSATMAERPDLIHSSPMFFEAAVGG